MGAGESASVPSAAAVANAIFDATGVRLLEVPFTPSRVLAALKAAEMEAKLAAMDPEKAAKVRAALAAKAARDKQKKEA